MANVFVGNTMKRVFIIPSAVSKDGAVKGSISINPGCIVEADKELIDLHKKESRAFKALISGNHIMVQSKMFNLGNVMQRNPESKKAPIQLNVDKKIEIKGTKTITLESSSAPEGTQGGE